MVNGCFKASNIENITGDRLAPRLTFGLNHFKKCILERRTGSVTRPLILITHSAEVSNRLLRCTLISNLLSINVRMLRLKIVPAPNITCLAHVRNTITKIVVSTSRGPTNSGNVGFFKSSNFGLSSRRRCRVRTCLSRRKSSLPEPSTSKLNAISRCPRNILGCTRCLRAAVPSSLSNVAIYLSTTGKTTSPIIGHLFTSLRASFCAVNTGPSNVGVGGNINSARPSILNGFIIRGGTSINLTFSNSTSHYVTMSRGKHVVSNSHVVFVYNGCLGRHGGLGRGAVISAIVDGLNFRLTIRTRNVATLGARINSHCIIRRVHGGNCGLNNRRSKRIIFLSVGAAKSNLLANVRLLGIVGRANGGLSRLTSRIALCPRRLIGMHISRGSNMVRVPTIGTIVRRIRSRVTNGKHVLIHPDKARPLLHIVTRTRASRGYRSCIVHVMGIMGTRVNVWRVRPMGSFVIIRRYENNIPQRFLFYSR